MMWVIDFYYCILPLFVGHAMEIAIDAGMAIKTNKIPS